MKSLSYLILKREPWCDTKTEFQYTNCCKENNYLLTILPPKAKQK